MTVRKNMRSKRARPVQTGMAEPELYARLVMPTSCAIWPIPEWQSALRKIALRNSHPCFQLHAVRCSWRSECIMPSMTSRDPLTPSTIDRLKREIQKLKDENSNALRQAIFLGMTEQEAEAQNERRQRKSELARRLSLLQEEES